MSKLQLILIKNKVQYDITQLIDSVKWSGKKGSAPRTLAFNLLNDNNQERAGIDIEQGHTCIFKYDGNELFRGIILRQDETSSSKKASYKAYDLGIYLSNNKDTFSYTNKRADQVFQNLCNRYGIPIGEVANTGYTIGELIQSKKKAWDLLLNALAKTFSHTGKRYYIRAEKGKLSLFRRSDDVVNVVAETGTNIISYKRTKSYEKIVTRVVCYNDENSLVASAKRSDIESRVGIFQNVLSYDDEKSTAQLKKLCQSTLDEESKGTHSLSITLIGNTDLISGCCINVIIKPLEISRKYYIDSDTHSFNADGSYTTQLTLNLYDENEWKDDDDE